MGGKEKHSNACKIVQTFCIWVVKLFLLCVFTIQSLFRYGQETGEEEPSENHGKDFFSQESSKFLKICCCRRTLVARKLALLQSIFRFFLRRVPHYEMENFYNSSAESKSTDQLVESNANDFRPSHRSNEVRQRTRPAESHRQMNENMSQTPTLVKNHTETFKQTCNAWLEELPLTNKDKSYSAEGGISHDHDDHQQLLDTETESISLSSVENYVNPNRSFTEDENFELTTCAETGEKQGQEFNEPLCNMNTSSFLQAPKEDAGTATLAFLDSNNSPTTSLAFTPDYQPEADASNTNNNATQVTCDVRKTGTSIPTAKQLPASSNPSLDMTITTECEYAAHSGDKAIPINPTENSSPSAVLTSSDPNHVLNMNSSYGTGQDLSTATGLLEVSDSPEDKISQTHCTVDTHEKSLTSNSARKENSSENSSAKNMLSDKKSEPTSPIEVTVAYSTATQNGTMLNKTEQTEVCCSVVDDMATASHTPSGKKHTEKDILRHPPAMETMGAQGPSQRLSGWKNEATATDKCLHEYAGSSQTKQTNIKSVRKMDTSTEKKSQEKASAMTVTDLSEGKLFQVLSTELSKTTTSRPEIHQSDSGEHKESTHSIVDPNKPEEPTCHGTGPTMSLRSTHHSKKVKSMDKQTVQIEAASLQFMDGEQASAPNKSATAVAVGGHIQPTEELSDRKTQNDEGKTDKMNVTEPFPPDSPDEPWRPTSRVIQRQSDRDACSTHTSLQLPPGTSSDLEETTDDTADLTGTQNCTSDTQD